MPNLADMGDEELRRRKFATMQRLCDEKGLAYPASLVAWLLDRQKERADG